MFRGYWLIILLLALLILFLLTNEGFMNHMGQKIKFVPITRSMPIIEYGEKNSLLIPNSYAYKNRENYVPSNIIEKLPEEVENDSLTKFADFQLAKEETRMDGFKPFRPKSKTNDRGKIMLG